ncbi:adenosine monophosphate-protein transferase SoFic [Janthinobacterium sp. HH103]|nr:adenosine monophosphate-protein transferase SoFic [Janthinobacterium sp. HH100]OEZ66843.1 adenosine monophosphate-protein transferase SoFic [Janthinobacterium sp. HH103]QOU70627.1 Adenosine monophosphate-protein transferase SoFic [Janthinobacterium sp. HH102]
MQRGLTGTYTSTIAGGVACQAFVPLPLPPVPALDLNGKLQSRLDEALIALGRLDAISTLLPDARLFLYSYVRKEAVMSSQIEGTQSSLSDLMLYEIDGQPGVPLDDVQEVSCYVKAMSLGVERIRQGQPISFRLLTEVHKVLMTSGRGVQRSPGEFRRNQVWIGGHRADEATFVPPPANQLAECWAALENFINDVPQPTAAIIKAALSHVQFETIHPFLDGNGRLGRMLILVDARILQEPLLYLSVFFKQHRETYYSLLQQVRISGNWEAWLLFFADAIAATANQAVSTAQALTQLLAQDKARLAELGRLAGSARQILDALFAHPILNIAALSKTTGLTAATVGKALDAMAGTLGMVQEVTGQKRNRVYAYGAYINILNQETS